MIKHEDSVEFTSHDGEACPVHQNLMGKKIEACLCGFPPEVTYPSDVIWKWAGSEPSKGDLVSWRFVK